MYENLKGKKLLIIGSDATNMEILKAAKEMGIYTIAADGITDRTKTPTKNNADDSWDIDYSKTDEVADKCLECGVNGVIAGCSEHRVLAACRIAAKLNLPFFATEEQVELTRNKRAFKDLCISFDVPTPKDYCFSLPVTAAEKENIEYPVIVKPSDYGGRKGISVCYSEKELDIAIEKAKGYTGNNTIIIEDYLDGLEFSSVYNVSDGDVVLAAVNEKHITDDQEIKTGLCECLISPSSAYDRYVNELDAKVQNLIANGIKAKNGNVFFQGMITDKKIYIFEMGYRINANNDFLTIDKFNNINYMKMLISHSLSGSMGDDIHKNNPLFPQKACTLLLHAHGGVIDVFDYESLKTNKNIYSLDIQGWSGKEIVEDGSTGQLVMKIKLAATTLEELAETINFIYDNVTVKDAHGNDMLFKRFDTNKLYQK